jgi:hypothetical protein
MKDRRVATRLLCAEMVELVWSDESGRELHRVGNLEDISCSGYCFQIDEPLRAGTAIKLRYSPDGELPGTVRYSFCRHDSYVLGVEFDGGNEWSRSRFLPSHLLDPRELDFSPELIDGCAPPLTTTIQ